MKTDYDEDLNIIILGKYQKQNMLGQGKFGKVFKGIRIKDQEHVAIKIELSKEFKILKHEATILNYLHTKGVKQIPILFWYGIFLENPTLVMTYYQNSLEDYVKYKSVSQEKLDQIMSLLYEILENVHLQHVIHRDIKPQNIMMKNGELFLIDFGLSTFYVDENFKHIECKRDREYIIGTPKYISYHIHDGWEPSRRDDLISLGYLYLEIQLGSLPWSSMPKSSMPKSSMPKSSMPKSNNMIESSNLTLTQINQDRKQMKSWENITKLCFAKETNTKIYKYMEECYQLQYYEVCKWTV